MQSPENTLTIPLFPLGTTLFPDGVLGLKIFEVRYLDMTRKCLRNHTPFGVITLDQGSEIRVPGQEIEFFEVGTLADIVHFDAVQPSLFMIRCKGGKRFRIRNRTLQDNGLWCAEVSLIEPDPSIDVPPELDPSARSLSKIIQTITDQAISPSEMPFLEPYQLTDCGWVANRCAELLDLPAAQKQHLLNMENPRLRLDMIQDILEEMGVFKNDSETGI